LCDHASWAPPLSESELLDWGIPVELQVLYHHIWEHIGCTA
jgi:cytochrome c-type biogenesis protein CcmH/NrfF